VKALACQLPRESGVPLSRYSSSEIASEVVKRGIVASISDATVWRWLSEDAIRPWQHRSWVFPRDPNFQEKAARVLDLYQGVWEGEELGPDEYVICADEKTSIQARSRKRALLPPAPGEAMRVEHEYERKGALAYLAGWDTRRAKVFGRCEAKSGIKAFDKLVEQVMSQEPYLSAKRVFWICTKAFGRGRNSDRMTTSYAPTKRRASRPGAASGRSCHRLPERLCGSNTSMSAAEHGPTWQPGTCGKRRSLAIA